MVHRLKGATRLPKSRSIDIMATVKTVAQVTAISKARKPVAPVAQLFIQLSETEKVAVDTHEFDYEVAVVLGTAGNNFDSTALNAVFANVTAPTWKGYQNEIKARNKTLPVAKREKVPTSKSHNALYLRFNNIAKIVEARDLGFNPLAYWNASTITKKHKTVLNASDILNGARAFINGAKDPVSAEEKATKQVLALYKTLQDTKGKAWVLAEKQLTVMMQGLGIELPEIADEVEADE